MADEFAKYVIRLRIHRKVSSEFCEPNQVVDQSILEWTLVRNAVRRTGAGDKQVKRPEFGQTDQTASGFVHCQAAQAMTKESERQIEQGPHFRKQPRAELLDVDDRLFFDTAQPTGGLNCDHLDARVKKLGPAAINGGAAARERKTEQSQARRRPRIGNDKPSA